MEWPPAKKAERSSPGRWAPRETVLKVSFDRIGLLPSRALQALCPPVTENSALAAATVCPSIRSASHPLPQAHLPQAFLEALDQLPTHLPNCLAFLCLSPPGPHWERISPCGRRRVSPYASNSRLCHGPYLLSCGHGTASELSLAP